MVKSNDIIQLIRSLNPSAQVSENTQLLKEGILDSLSIMNLAIQIKEQFHIEINIFDITPENFATAEAIAELINRKTV